MLIDSSILAFAPTDFEEFVTEFRAVPEGWSFIAAGAVLIVVLVAVAWMYRHEGRKGASPRARWFLAIVRCLVLLGLAVVLLEPIRVRILRRWLESYTLVLVDSSSSMDLADFYRDPRYGERVKKVLPSVGGDRIRRADIARGVLETNGREFIRELASRNRVRLFSFSDEPRLLGTIEGDRAPAAGSSALADAIPAMSVDAAPTEIPATGPVTNIDRAIRRAVEAQSGAPVAALVVLSDGGFNQGGTAEEAARYARERRLPVHVVGVGDPSPLRNVRITEVLAPANAFLQDPFPISARIAADGLDGQLIQVELREHEASAGSAGAVVESKLVTIKPGGAVDPITFQRRQTTAGRYVYTVEVAPLEFESLADDNSRQATVNVVESRTRVLIIAGLPNWDYVYLSRLLERDDTFDVSCWLQSADISAVRDGDIIIDHMPIIAEELFQYDVIVIMDANPEEFPPDWGRIVDRFVTEQGGGFLYAAARPYSPALLRSPILREVVDLLPVVVDPEADLVLNRIGFYQLTGSPIEIPDGSQGHAVLQLADDSATSRMVWRTLGDVFWHFPVLREKPAATVLMRHGDPKMRNSYGGHVLAAAQFAGAGRTGFMGFDSTYRWRRVSETAFNRFWVQWIRFLGEGRLLAGAKRGTILTDSDQFALGEVINITARLFDNRFELLTEPQIAAQVSVEDQRTEIMLTAQPDRPGWYEGRFVPDRVGAYRISLRLPDPPGQPVTEILHEVRVIRPNLEILRPQMDTVSLNTLAERSAGGRYFEVDQAASLPELIPDLHEEVTIRSRPTSLWDNRTVLLILVGLLALEWAVRKWKHLL